MKIAIFAGRKNNGIIPEPLGGTGLYRQYLPHEMMSKWGHEVQFTDVADFNNLRNFDLVQFSKSYFVHAMDVVRKLRQAGVKTMIDYDDYWVLPQSHYLYDAYRKQNTTRILDSALREFDYVTCTTPLLRDEIAKINPNVEVFENAVDPDNPQFRIVKQESDSVRFGWVGGHCHYPDLVMLDGNIQRLNGEFNVSLFGHDNQKNSVYDRFAQVLSGRYKLIKENKFLIYRGTTARKYTQFYNLIDVALAPLVGDKFNSMKSELKMVEAGFMKKAMVVSDVWPYRYLINDKNCLSVAHKHHWSKQMQKFINNPSMIEDYGEELYESVKDKYDLHKVTKRREQWYESIVI